MAYMNPLETEEEIEDYKRWLASKPPLFLKCVLGNFMRDKEREIPKYVNLSLRIQLVTKELEKKNSLK